jgi:hypothetical protein
MRTTKPAVSRTQLPLVIAAFAGTLGVWGCSGPNDKAPVGASSASPPAAQTATTPTPDVPSASAAVGGSAATADAAKNSDPAMEPMSKKEEANAMPMPGQVNDHSTLSPKPAQK